MSENQQASTNSAPAQTQKSPQNQKTNNKQSSQSTVNLQDAFLNEVKKNRIQITVYLVNGFQMKGIVKNFDNFTILLVKDGKEHLIYKHAVTTLIPTKALDI